MITASGLRGRGGAAFPTGIKWKTVLDQVTAQKYVTCNADEGDSGTFADRMLMEGDPLTLIEGMTIAGIAVGATQGYIYLRAEYPHAHRALNTAIAAAYQARYLGADVAGSGKRFDLEVRLGAGAYICGEETSMLESLEGKRGEVRVRPPLPGDQGAVRAADHRQQRHYARERALDPGPRRAGLRELRHGQVARHAADPAGRQHSPRRSGRARLWPHACASSSMTTAAARRAADRSVPSRWAVRSGRTYRRAHFETAVDYEALAGVGALLGHGGIVVFDDTVDMARMARYAMEFCAIESCGKCTPCRIGSTRGVEVIDRILAGEDGERNMQLLEQLCETMVQGSLCGLGGMAPFPVQSALKHFREDFRAQVKVSARASEA